MTTAYSYLRFSTPEQAKGDSFRRQMDMAERYAIQHGLTLDTKLRMTDEGVSAYRAKNVRQGALGRFLRAIDDGHVEDGSYLLVESLDRVSRASPWDAMPVFQQIINAGVTIVTLQDNRTWSREALRDNPYRIFESLLVMIRANEESETKSRRLKAVWDAKRRSASTKAMTSRVPAWLRLEGKPASFVVDEQKAAVVVRIYEMTATGTGQHRIAETLNTEGVPCFGTAAHWHRSYVKKLLANPAVIGTLVPHELIYEEGKRLRKAHEPVLGYYPPIVEEALFQRVQAQRMDKRAPSVRAGVVANIFGGLARCPLCSGTMTRVSKGATGRGGRPYLVCARAKAGAGCRYRAVKLDEAEDALVRNAGWLMATAPSGDASVDDRIKDVELQASVLSDQIETLVTELAERPSPAIRARVAEYEGLLEQLRSEEQDLWALHGTVSGPSLQSRIDDLLGALEADPVPHEQANALMRQVFSKVVVNYVAGRLEFEWRQGGSTDIMFAWPEQTEDEPELPTAGRDARGFVEKI
ncbi:DNA invertase Pin-like site-specific DNA recombinase [Bosea sp. BE271]|uniref:recombinase family protein n=1 Tax=Bosea TaxID=85413 RepID=UPI002856048F|nr:MULTISPECIES: recombinase family protein [Bosea]MDR6831542.1 DNA invertase Pin-like site-specific DNA recombinase [Bosea robiniae]MDR6898251.1 DNA invertase Pin-like site-specific DNA recombinase [Bosea sp. BE109]MDR7141648.1 DNA invertase Pin-like site-specific DNA recombinase [Bosea sp. BE168]MDR7178271.1 DNA invertase Pin-like site-specific DNA recombinase [Bosea sp. BE271]